MWFCRFLALHFRSGVGMTTSELDKRVHEWTRIVRGRRIFTNEIKTSQVYPKASLTLTTPVRFSDDYLPHYVHQSATRSLRPSIVHLITRHITPISLNYSPHQPKISLYGALQIRDHSRAQSIRQQPTSTSPNSTFNPSTRISRLDVIHQPSIRRDPSSDRLI